jgi:NADH-quinone oxidoreductase subunit G
MTDTAGKTDLVTVTIDGTELQVPKGTLVIRAAEQLGITIPRFCDHPLLDPLGACRQCIVDVEGQRKPLTACTTTCTDGMVVKTHLTSDVAREAQEGILEFLLINHPLDCPQCDKGGECPLQDQTLAHGPADSRFGVESKRRYVKPLPISAQIALDRERCVLCARCTRFSSEISGDPFIELFERGALEQVAVYEDEPYESYFSGNVAQICPVGALTASSYRFKARPFDLFSHSSVCNQCSAGCNLRVDVRRGEIQRQLARENKAVNEAWNCDRGRFAYEYVASTIRLRQPIARNDVGSPEPTSWLKALRQAAAGFSKALQSGGPSAVGVLTGGRLTDEDAYAVSRFARDVLGTDNVDFRMRPRTDEERDVLAAVAGTLGPTYDDVEHAPVSVIAGLDPQEEVPILFLRLRKAWRRRNQRIVVVGPTLGHLDEIAWRWIPTPAGGEAAVLEALATGSGADVPPEVLEALGACGALFLAGERLSMSPGALRAAARLAAARDGRFAWVPRRNNARGALDAGLLPGLLPGGRTLDDPGLVDEAWSGVGAKTLGMDSRQMLEAAAAGDLKALYLVGVDPARDFEDPRLAKAALEKVDFLVVQDLLETESARYADVILPAMSAQERVGSFTTWEGRRQPFAAAVPAQGLSQHDWDIVRQLAMAMGFDFGWETADDVRREAAPLFEAAHSKRERVAALAGAAADSDRPTVPRGADEYDVVVIDQLLGTAGVMLTDAKALQATARPATVWIHPADAESLGVTDGMHVALVGSADRAELPALVTDRVVRGCVVVPGTSSGVAAAALVDPGGLLRVRLEKAEGSSEVRYPSPERAAALPGAEHRALRPHPPAGLGAHGSGPEDSAKPGGAHPTRDGLGRVGA